MAHLRLKHRPCAAPGQPSDVLRQGCQHPEPGIGAEATAPADPVTEEIAVLETRIATCTRLLGRAAAARGR